MTTKETRWTAETESRLIEMYRQEHTLEEMARELSLPLDIVEERILGLVQKDGTPEDLLR